MTSTIKVNNIQNQCGANIINENSNTITIGASGDTISLASGASQTGFGREGSVDWQTSIITAASFTAVNGQGFFVDTSSNAVTANLPAGSAGAIVSFKDYAQNFASNNLTVSANGSEKIEGQTFDLILKTKGLGVTLVYGDATKGWQAVNSNEVVNTEKFVTATGGTESTSGNFKIHTFTGPGAFTVSCAGSAQGSNSVDYLVVAGGGASGRPQGSGGGGAGGFRESPGAASGCYSVSPLAGGSAVPVTEQAYPITVGGGGAAPGPQPHGASGSDSIALGITSTGGGGGGEGGGGTVGTNGGSGGGGGGRGSQSGGTGNTPPVSPSQGFPGGVASAPNSPTCSDTGGGGGGATAAGGNGAPNGPGGSGGAGATTSIDGSSTAYAGGGGGGSQIGSGGAAGSGGGGTGNSGGGTSNTGGGAGGVSTSPPAGYSGGSGIVVIRYKFQ